LSFVADCIRRTFSGKQLTSADKIEKIRTVFNVCPLRFLRGPPTNDKSKTRRLFLVLAVSHTTELDGPHSSIFVILISTSNQCLQHPTLFSSSSSSSSSTTSTAGTAGTAPPTKTKVRMAKSTHLGGRQFSSFYLDELARQAQDSSACMYGYPNSITSNTVDYMYQSLSQRWTLPQCMPPCFRCNAIMLIMCFLSSISRFLLSLSMTP
jgi:hypothetical protein